MKMPWIVRIGWIVLIAALLSPLEASAQTQTLVLQGGTLIDGTGKAPITNAVVVVEGNRITAVGSQGQVTVPQNAKIIKTDGQTILPGLIDGHIHLFSTYQPEMFLHYGVTTIGDLNNDTSWILLQRQDLNSGKIKGPRLFSSCIAFGGPSSVTNTQSRVVIRALRNPEQARAFVRELKAAGCDVIKTDYSLTYDEIAATIDEATKLGLTVVGHTQNIRLASALGHKYMEHTNTLAWAIIAEMPPDKQPKDGCSWPDCGSPEQFMDMSLMPAMVKLLVERGVYVNPTLVSHGINEGRWRNPPERAREWVQEGEDALKDPVLRSIVPMKIQEMWTKSTEGPSPDAEGYQKVQEFLRQFAAAGGKIAAGTDETGDEGTIPGISLHNEMQLLSDAGVPPMKVIQAATLWSAESIGQGKNLGSVEPGKLADFTIIEGNPLDDIAVTKNVKMVIKDGQVVDTSYDPHAITAVPRPFGTLPLISAVTPPVTTQGAGDLTIQVQGVRFNPKSVVRFDNTDLKTQFVTPTKLTAVIDSKLLENTGSYAVYVLNPGMSGSPSNAIYLLIDSK